MDAAVKSPPRHPLLVTALAPLVPQILSSAFNICYNIAVVDPLLRAEGLSDRFVITVIVWNAIVYPGAIAIWSALILSLQRPFQRLRRGEIISDASLEPLRRRLVHLPWFGAIISGLAWLLGIPVFLISLGAAGHPLASQLYWHLPISLCISGFIALTQSFYLIEFASQWGLFPTFFRNARPDQLKGIRPISLRTRGFMWAVSASICPIGSLLLLFFALPSPGVSPQWFGFFVGAIGIVFGLASALLIGRSVAEPVNQLRAGTQKIARGQLEVEIPLRRADEFGALIGEFNRMAEGLREKEQLRRTFGLHVGKKAAEQILARDPKLGGVTQDITVMFVDIRAFTEQTARLAPDKTVALLNEFLRAMVEVVEDEHGGMINKFLGDGFMALFGIGGTTNHATEAVAAARAIQRKLVGLNEARRARGEAAIAIGIGINTGQAIVGSIGSPERMEFTVIGNAVNLAARIEALNKVLGTSLLISRSTRDQLPTPNDARPLPSQVVKGIEEPVEIFTIYDSLEYQP